MHYVKRAANSDRSAGLDSNHSHFLLVDAGGEGWGSEIPLRAALEGKLCESLRVPSVLLVVQGGQGTFKTVAAALKMIYRAVDAQAGEAELGAFEDSLWGRRYPAIAQSWRRAWTRNCQAG